MMSEEEFVAKSIEIEADYRECEQGCGMINAKLDNSGVGGRRPVPEFNE